jgi:hypothetical protein
LRGTQVATKQATSFQGGTEMRRTIVFPGTLIIVVLALSSLFLINPRPRTDAQSTADC